jgi:O-antigen ligase
LLPIAETECASGFEMNRQLPIVPGDQMVRRSLRMEIRWWRYLSAMWAGLFVLIFTVGRYDLWKREIIWGGGALLAVVSLPLVLRRYKRLPKEAMLITVFILWALLGGINAELFPAFVYNLRLVTELMLVLLLLGIVIRMRGSPDHLWWAFIAVAVFNTSVVLFAGEASIVVVEGPVERQRGITDNPNALAFLCFMGFLGALALFGEKKSVWVRAVCLAAGGVAFLGMVLAGSRGAYLSFLLAVGLWPLMVAGSGSSRIGRRLVVSLATVLILFFVFGWTQAYTNLGRRTTSGLAREDSSSEARLTLIQLGLEIAYQRPIVGAGLGQFGVVSGTGYYAHNEWVELLATTGVPGFVLFMAVYWSAWKRLSLSLRYIRDPVLRYRINFSRMTLIILVVAGATFRPNFISVDTMFLLALVVGVANWAGDCANREWQTLAFNQGRATQANPLLDPPQPVSVGHRKRPATGSS